MWEWRYSYIIIDFGTRWRYVVGFMPLLLYAGIHTASDFPCPFQPQTIMLESEATS
jgi:hypothetical protein